MKKKLISTLLAFTLISSGVIPVTASDFSVETEVAEEGIFQEEFTEASVIEELEEDHAQANLTEAAEENEEMVSDPDDFGTSGEQEPAAGDTLTDNNTAETGSCGNNVFYSVKNGIMTIYGSGTMFHYAWYPEKYRTDIKEIQIADDSIKDIGSYAFGVFPSLKKITIPRSVTSISDAAFSANAVLSGEQTILADLTIEGYAGSAAEAYAAKLNIPFHALAEITSLEMPKLTLENKDEGISLSWNQIKGAKNYYLYRKPSGGKYSKIATLDMQQSTYLDTTAAAGNAYVYAVRAVREKILSNYKGVSICRLKSPVLSVSNTVDGVTLKWNKIAGAKNYNVYRKRKNEKYFSRLTSLSSGKLNYVDGSASSGTTYQYAVRAVNGNDKSAYIPVQKTYVAATKLSISNGTKGPVLTWTKVAHCSQYAVYRKKGNEKYVRLTLTDQLTYQDKTATSGTTYSYGVVAVIGNTTSGMTGIRDTFLSLVKTTVKSQSTGVKITWTTAAGAKKYMIYRRTNGGKYEKIASLSNTETSYTDKKVTAGNTYIYCVRAYHSGSYGPYTEVKIKK